MYEIIKISQALFTSYVLLRKTQSSVSLRLTAPFKRGLFALSSPPYLRRGGFELFAGCLAFVSISSAGCSNFPVRMGPV
jgi:hypothetical protein